MHKINIIHVLSIEDSRLGRDFWFWFKFIKKQEIFFILSLYKFKMYFSLRMVSKRKYFILFLLK